MIDPARLRSSEQLAAALAASATLPLVLLKHSTRCPTSSRAHEQFERFAADLDPTRASAAIVYVVEDRTLSNDIAQRFGIRHESPQAFVISSGAVTWHDSHDAIDVANLTSALAALES